jgi:WD40 repeat protein/beta-lactamase regulating signal transducer with metallopeptidase domain
MRLPESVLFGGPWVSVALVQVTLVALLGWLGWLLARREGPALRAAVLLAALMGLVLVPVAVSVAPVWLSLPEWACLPTIEPEIDSPNGAPVSPVAAPDERTVTVLVAQPPPNEKIDPQEAREQVGEIPVRVKAEDVVLNPAPPSEDSRSSALPVIPSRRSWSPAGLLGMLWVLGAAIFLTRSLARLALLYRRSAWARPIRERDWTECMESLTPRYGLSAVALRESRSIASPLTLGLFWPVILLPRGRRGWSAEQRVLILGHELAHIRRRDFLAGLVAELAVCLCWFHPLVRWLAGRLRLEQEYAADAWVASSAADPAEYVRCLARLALELNRGHGFLAPALWRRRPEILRRIDMLRRNSKRPRTRVGAWAGWTVAVLTAVVCLAVGGVGTLRSAADTPKETGNASEARDKATVDRLGDPLPAGALARFGTIRMRHGAEVTFVAFGPGGKTLLTAGRDNTIRLWDRDSGKELRRFAAPRPTPVKQPEGKGKAKADADVVMEFMASGGNDGGNSRIAVTADGKILAVSRGNVIQLYNVETGESLRQIQGKARGYNTLLFSPDGKTLAARGADSAFVLWTIETGKEVCQIKPPLRPERDGTVLILGGNGDSNAPGMAFTPDGKTLVVAATDNTNEGDTHSLKFWEIGTGKESSRIKASGTVGVVAVDSEGQFVAYGIGNILHLCEMKTGKELRQIKTSGGRIVTASFTPDGKALAIRGRNQQVSLWETQTGKELHSLSDAQVIQQGGGGLVLMTPGFSAPERRPMALSADGKQIASADGSTVRVWETATGKELPLSDGHRKAPSMITLSRDGKTAVSWGGDRVVRRWEAATGKLLGNFAAPPRTTQAAFSGDGRIVALANADNTIRIHDAATGKELHNFKGHPNGTAALAFAPDGKTLASRSSAEGSIRLYDASAGRELRQIPLPSKREPAQGITLVLGGGSRNRGAGLAFSPDGKLLATPGADGRDDVKSIVLVDVVAGKVVRKIELPQLATSLTFSPDGRTLATENADRTITLWETASGKKRASLGKAPADQPRPDARDGNVEIVIEMGGGGGSRESAGLVRLAFSPDGRALVARGADRTVRVWDVSGGKEIAQLKGHEGRIETVAFAPDGKTLASGATDTTVLLWDASASLKDLAKTQTVEVPGAEMETLWGDLAGEDSARALQSVVRLTSDPRQTVPFLAKRLKPASRVDPSKINGWIGELESEKYPVRKAAADNLIRVGEQAVPALRKVLTSSPPLETRKRIEELLEKLTGGTLTTEDLRLVRAVEILERIGTPQARQVLRTLAKGAPGTLPTREAEAALGRGQEKPR